MIIDITNEVFTNLKTNITNATLLTSYPNTTPTFPCITFEEISNNVDKLSVDTTGEHVNELSFEINIYTEGDNKMSVAKGFRKSADDILSDSYGMRRDFSSAIPNYLDEHIYKYTMRYSCNIDSNKTIYRRN